MSVAYDNKVEMTFVDKFHIANEFVRVQCVYKFNTVYLEYHSFLPEKLEVIKRVSKDTLNVPQKEQDNNLNVMILGIDTLSRMNFHRTMKKSSETLHKLEGIEFFGYNKVGK